MGTKNRNIWQFLGQSVKAAWSKRRLALAVRIALVIAAYGLFGASRSGAQSPATSARAPLFDLGLGYSYVNIPLGNNRVSLNGGDGNLSVYVNPYVGLKFDVGYVRDNNVFNTGHNSDMISYMGGPVIYPYRRKRIALYAEALFGAARVTGPILAQGGGLLIRGYANKFAWAAGGGLEYKFEYKRFRSFSLRAGADYLHTAYFTPTVTLTGQNDARITVNLVYSFASRNR